MAEIINPESLVPMDLFTADFPIAIEIAYKQPAPDNMFGVIYRPDARLWLHESLARLVLLASVFVGKAAGMRCVLYDGLRTVNAQERMAQSPIVKRNLHWLEGETRLLSPPGSGGHPRGMAIDISLQTAHGKAVDMGTEFDFLAPDAAPGKNPAHREHPDLSDSIRKNRAILTGSMMTAAKHLSLPLLPLPQEWWDFRLPGDFTDRFAPLADEDLPPAMRMTDDLVNNGLKDLPDAHFAQLKARLYEEISDFLTAG